MNTKKILAMILTVLLLVITASCSKVVIVIPVSGTPGNPVQSDVATAPSQQGTVTTAPSQTDTATTAADTQTPTQAGDTPTQATDTPTQATDTPSQTPGSSVPTGKEAIITYYCTAYNKIATDAVSATKTYDYTSNYNDILNIGGNSTLQSIAGSLMTKFMVEDTTAKVFTTLADVPPVGVSSLNISPSLVSEASCTDKGTYYEVVLKSTGTDSNYEVDSVAGVGSAGCIGPLLRTEDVSGAAGSLISFDGLHTKYATASVNAKIDKASGHITDLEFFTPSILHFDKVTAAVIVKVSNCDIGLLFHQIWTVQY